MVGEAESQAHGEQPRGVDDLALRYYESLAAAFVRGRLGVAMGVEAAEEAIRRGLAAGLRLQGFKRSVELPRVRKVLGILRGMAPERVLDVGSGRGVFLWPLLDAFPGVPVVAVDRDLRHVADVHAVRLGGVAEVAACCMDAERLALRDGSVDVTTVLEVLEHVGDPERVAAEAVRVARRFVVASVPSHPDDNPEHVRFFTGAALERLLLQAGATRVTVEYVPGHMVAVARVGGRGRGMGA